jgi:iron complex outermembrane receptor protein
MKRYIAVFTLMFEAAMVMAQDIYSQAENAYNIGRLDSALVMLKNHETSFKGTELQKAYRLMSLCYLGLDSIKESEDYARQLLQKNKNYYGSLQDPARFVDMISRLREGQGTTISTASGQEEKIEEAPVPVIVITREMIDMLSNNRSIGQILAHYIPGMSEICSYAFSNVTMHGVYTAGQEKILVMENGHRLNARSTNNGKLDYAISTEKIDHIEVLRGPASSLYGNVALTAVVNIYTKKGKDINGVKGKYGLGSYGTHRADLIAGFGSDVLKTDVMAWASIYTSQGEMYRIPQGTGYSATPHDGYAYIGRYEGKPSYDLGFTLKVNDFKLMMSRKYGKQVPQYSYYGEVYDYDSYRKLGGNKSGYSIEETHLDLGYQKRFGNFNIDISAYGDWYTIDDYSVLSDSTMNIDFNRDGSAVKTPEGKYVYRLYHGMFQDLLWEEYTIGAIAKADVNYKLGSMRGNILVGAQYELFTLDANDTHLGENYEEMTMVKPESQYTIKVGRERSVSGFLQVKHFFFHDNLILNAGLRYDNKYRKNEEHVTAFSPRVALIYTPTKLFNTKISYSRAFVDAPYLYRQNTTGTYKGSANLMPEYLNAFQLDFMGTVSKFSYDVNLFYNYLTDIITNNQSTDVNAPKYINAGTLNIAGVEAELGYSTPSFHAKTNATWQRALSAEQYTYSDHYIYSVPSVIANLTCEKRLFPWKNEKANDSKHSLWLSGNLQYTSRTLNKANSRVKGSTDFYLSDRALVDLRLKYDYNEMMQLSIDCDNVFNTTYEIGGTSYLPYRYPGRIVMGTIAFKL